MYGTATLPTASRFVVQSPTSVLRLMDAMKDDAALEFAAVLDGVSGKQIDRANVPTCGKYAVSRALNGGDCNPLYRIVGVFALMKRLGLSRSRAQRVIDWLQEVVDNLWPEGEEDLDAVLDKEQELDAMDDLPQQRATRGCVESMQELLEIKRRQRAHDRTVIFALRRRIESAQLSS